MISFFNRKISEKLIVTNLPREESRKTVYYFRYIIADKMYINLHDIKVKSD